MPKFSIAKFLSGFLHPEIVKNEHTVEGGERAWKARLAIGVCFIVSLFTILMFVIRYNLEGLQQKSLLLLPIAGIVFCFFPYIFIKRLNKPKVSNFLILFFGCLILPIRVVSDGGVSSSTLAWFTLWPVLTTLLLNIRWGGFFTLVALAQILILSFSNSLGIPIRASDPLPIVRGSIVIILVLILFFVIHRFETERLRQLNSLRESEEKLRFALKNESLAKMAEGLAHEVNNPLTIIQGNLQKIKNSETNDKNLERLDKIENGIQRVNSLIKRLQFYSKRDLVLEKGEFSFSQIVSKVLTRIKTLVNTDGIEIKNYVSSDHSYLGDELKIKMALEILLLNAIEELNSSKQETKEIRIDLTQTDQEFILSVTDNGNGIHEDLKNKIMDPFFTTKEMSNSPGLGLAIAKGIVEKHSGKLDFYSDSRITTFNIVLPKMKYLHRGEAS